MDTETQIAQKLQANIPKPTPQPSAPITPDDGEDRGFVDDIGDNTNIYRLYDYFGVDTAFRGGDAEQKLQVIYRWAADKAQSTDYLAVANVLTRYSQGMGVGSMEQNNLNRMYQFIQLDRQINQLQQEQGLLYE